jgi:hypothetical protein
VGNQKALQAIIALLISVLGKKGAKPNQEELSLQGSTYLLLLPF